MSRTIMCLVNINKVSGVTCVRRHLSFRGVKEAVRRYFEPQSQPPFSYFCQVGEPVLRAPAQPVEPEVITKPEFQRMVKHMTTAMRICGGMGLSANQIGWSYQVFVVEVTKEHLTAFNEQELKWQQVELVPLRVFINPTMKIVDYATIKGPEVCISIVGHAAVVPRAKKVRIEALDSAGKRFVFDADGWTARIVQHEMDHLQGKLYIDRMDSTTFTSTHGDTRKLPIESTKVTFNPKTWFR